MKATKVFIILILLLLASLGASVYTAGFTEIPFLQSGEGTLSAEEAEMVKGKALEFIKTALVQPGTEVAVKDVGEDQGLYKMTIAVAGREVTSYMSKDFSTFFPSPREMGAVAGADSPPGEDVPAQEIPKSAKPEVYLFSMAFCPYGTQAEDMLKPVAELLGDAAEIGVHYVLYENYCGYKVLCQLSEEEKVVGTFKEDPSKRSEYCLDAREARPEYCSMHGISELNQGIRELCVYDNQPAKFWNFAAQVNSDCTVDDIETCWKQVAQATGVDTVAVESCFAANKLGYAKSEKELADKFGVRGSPTLVINGVTYSGARTSEGYKQAICGAFETAPEVCAQVLGEDTPQAATGGCGD